MKKNDYMNFLSSFLHALGQGEENGALALTTPFKNPIESCNDWQNFLKHVCWLNEETMFQNNNLIKFFLKDQGLVLEKHREVNQL